jgi:hypothetical protein
MAQTSRAELLSNGTLSGAGPRPLTRPGGAAAADACHPPDPTPFVTDPTPSTSHAPRAALHQRLRLLQVRRVLAAALRFGAVGRRRAAARLRSRWARPPRPPRAG